MKQEMIHTPTPWVAYTEPLRVDEIKTSVSHSFGPQLSGGSVPIVGFVVARDESHANADFIVRACNAHDDLVAALGAMLDAYEMDATHTRSDIRRFRAALAKAKGEQ